MTDDKIPAVVLSHEDVGEQADRPDRGVEEQAFWNRAAKARVKDIDLDTGRLQDSLDDITEKLEKALERQAEREVHGFALESFCVGLAINASGKLALVAEVGVEASIELTFTRRGAAG